VRRIDREAAVPRAEWDRYWSWLEKEEIACPADRPEFDRLFVRSNRPVAVPRPGLALLRRWPLLDVQERGRGDAFREEVRAAVDSALAAFGA
jgi:hypothetical protein